MSNSKKDFNGYDFDDPEMRKRMKYVIVTGGDLDVNNVYAFTNKSNLRDYFYLGENSGRNGQLNEYAFKEVQAIFEIKDITKAIKDSL
jgi:hypothetical protein